MSSQSSPVIQSSLKVSCKESIDSSFLTKRFLIVMGKGGVGRSTVSLGLGTLSAQSGRRTLVCLSNAPPRYAAALGGRPIGSDISNIAPGLDVVNMDPVSCEEEYGMQVLGNRLLHSLIFSNRVIRSFLDAVPGLAEWAMLGKATYHALETSAPQDRYQTVIFDAPATGHGLDLLTLPRAIVSAVPTGRMRTEAQTRIDLLENPDLCEVLPVTIPEEIPVQETREAIASLRRLRLPVKRVVVNMVRSIEMKNELSQLVAEHAQGKMPEWLLPAAYARSQVAAQEDCLATLQKEVRLPKMCLPYIEKGSKPGEFLPLLMRGWR